ncbi:hypothetical protein [Micromonospora sp. NPDC005979]|uniref:hypothetical protein n=1 Tax=Micromonospora sp. NPDC005979 TaxID=3156726 RepID=UPI0033B54F88
MTVPFPSDAPTSYEDSANAIYVRPGVIYHTAHVSMKAEIAAIIECWNVIADTWKELKLSWVGESAAAADAFNERLDRVQAELFGEPEGDGKDGKPGIFGLIRVVAVQASSNYDNAEHSVFHMFDALSEALGATGQADDGKRPENSLYNPIQITYGDV